MAGPAELFSFGLIISQVYQAFNQFLMIFRLDTDTGAGPFDQIGGLPGYSHNNRLPHRRRFKKF